MALLPENHAARIAFLQSRIATWLSNATAIGTTSALVNDVQTKCTDAAAALAAQQTAQNAAKSATQVLFEKMDALTNAGMIVIEQVRTKSRTAGDGVFALADLPAPSGPSPKPAPGKPTDLNVTLSETGALDLKWACPNPAGTQGTIYNVWRSVDGGALELVGGVGTKAITDDTLPAGSSVVMYQIQAVRSTAVGPWATFNVKFGVSSTGAATIASVTPGGAPKIAA